MTFRTIFYDTETTGVNAERDRIIEIAAYDSERDATFSTLVNPGMPIPAEATAIHHITDEMVSNAPPFSEVALQFAEFCDGDVVLVAHNHDGFDKHFLRAEYERNEIEQPAWKGFDTLKWARRYRPDLPRHSLQFLRETFGFPANQAHRALDDVIILHKVYEVMVDDLSIEVAMDLMQKKSALTHMSFGKHRGKPLEDVPKNYVQWLNSSGALDKPQNEELKEAFAALGVI